MLAMNRRPLAACLVLTFLSTAVRAQPATRPMPPDVEKRPVVIWSDGTRMAGDLYLPKSIKDGERLPAVVFCNGTGGTKAGPPERLGARFAQAGFIFLAFDYRGWGQSDGKLMALEKEPKPDEKGEVTIKARIVRWQMDFADQVLDVKNAISFLSGEPAVDPQRIGVIGTSYGGGIATWVAGYDKRVACAAAQVPGMGRGPAAERAAYALATKQARGEAEPVPFETGKLGGNLARYDQMRANPAKGIGYSAIEAAEHITKPLLIVDAENDELLDRHLNGEKVYEIVKARGVPAEYHLIKGITHYGVYRESFDEAAGVEVEWFKKHLKP
jgi:dipeptidyl aminopeptidase/acylaminoacyl peptidase